MIANKWRIVKKKMRQNYGANPVTEFRLVELSWPPAKYGQTQQSRAQQEQRGRFRSRSCGPAELQIVDIGNIAGKRGPVVHSETANSARIRPPDKRSSQAEVDRRNLADDGGVIRTQNRDRRI